MPSAAPLTQQNSPATCARQNTSGSRNSFAPTRRQDRAVSQSAAFQGATPDLQRIPAAPTLAPAHAAVSRIPLQKKLAIGAANDPLEHEADRVADRVMRMPDPAPVGASSVGADTLQRKCSCGGSASGTCEECKKKKLQRSAAVAASSEFAPPIVHDVLRSSGQPLDSATRSFFEPRLGMDLSSVRTHTDSRADQSAQAVNALAYTSGRDIVFREGAYSPSTVSGGRLLAHELAHVAQQSGTTPTLRREEKDDAGQGPKRGISVRTDCNEDQARMIAQAIVNARGMLRAAREWFISGDPNDPRLKALLRSHFGSASDQTRSAVHSKLTTVSNILEVAGDGRVLFNCVEASDPECLKHAKSTDAYVTPGQGYRIHLCPRYFSSDVGSDDRTWVMIHETCHVAGALGDRYIDVFGPTESGICFGPDMFRDDPLNNADSYTSFVKCLVSQNLAFTHL
jgi:hypothetical protein